MSSSYTYLKSRSYFTHTQNQLQPVFSNTAVRFAFYGGIKQQGSAAYAETLTCGRFDMRPQLMSLEASWGLFTSSGFNISSDAPLLPASGVNSAYYSINPTFLRDKLVQRSVISSTTTPITFRAEYKCLWCVYGCVHCIGTSFATLYRSTYDPTRTLIPSHTHYTARPGTS